MILVLQKFKLRLHLGLTSEYYKRLGVKKKTTKKPTHAGLLDSSSNQMLSLP